MRIGTPGLMAASAFALSTLACTDHCKPAQEQLVAATAAARTCAIQLETGRKELRAFGRLEYGVLSCDGELQEQRIAEARVAQRCR